MNIFGKKEHKLGETAMDIFWHFTDQQLHRLSWQITGSLIDDKIIASGSLSGQFAPTVNQVLCHVLFHYFKYQHQLIRSNVSICSIQKIAIWVSQIWLGWMLDDSDSQENQYFGFIFCTEVHVEIGRRTLAVSGQWTECALCCIQVVLITNK